MNTRHPSTYDTDFFAWTQDQAAHLRAGRLNRLDIANLVEEIEDVNTALKHELGNRLDILIAHLLKWRFQSDHRTSSWRRTIRHQRVAIDKLLQNTTSLRPLLADAHWLEKRWRYALDDAKDETHLDVFPSARPWSISQVLDPRFWPEPSGQRP